jgi:hypothetical protein
MKRLAWLSVVPAVVLSVSTAWAQGNFYVIAGGGPPVGTKITSLPCTINSPGFYYLTGNFTYNGTSNGITVASDDVTIDLMGFQIIGPGSSVTSAGISLFDGKNVHNNVEVRNGTLSGWYNGFTNQSPNAGLRNQALNLRIENCHYGISLGGQGNMVKGCTIEASENAITISGLVSGNTITNCQIGITGRGMISHNSVYNYSVSGISSSDASSLIGNTVIATTGTPTGIGVSTDNPVLVTQNAVSGPGIHFHGGSGTINVANTNAGF